MHPCLFIIGLIVFPIVVLCFKSVAPNPKNSLILYTSVFLFNLISFVTFVNGHKNGFYIFTSLLMMLLGLYWIIDLLIHYSKYKKEYEDQIAYEKKENEKNNKEIENARINFEKLMRSGSYSSTPTFIYRNIRPIIEVYFERNYSAFVMRISAQLIPIVIKVNPSSVTRFEYNFNHHYEGMDPATGALGGGLGGGFLGAVIGGAIANGHEQVDNIDLIIGIKGIGTYTIRLVENTRLNSQSVKDAASFADRFRNTLLNHNFFA